MNHFKRLMILNQKYQRLETKNMDFHQKLMIIYLVIKSYELNINFSKKMKLMKI